MTIIEKLAREICWAEFAAPKAVGKTKAQYWKDIADDPRAMYLAQARWLAAVLPKIDVNVLNQLN